MKYQEQQWLHGLKSHTNLNQIPWKVENLGLNWRFFRGSSMFLNKLLVNGH
jgi:hypothetical protein